MRLTKKNLDSRVIPSQLKQLHTGEEMSHMESPANSKLDQTDLMLIKELELDPRQSNRALSERLRISAETARKRLNRLLDEGIIRFRTVTQPYVLGYQAPVILALNVTRGKTDEVVEYLRPRSGIIDITLTAGRYDILALAILRNLRDLPDVFDREFGNIPYLIHTETILILDMIKMSWKFLNSNGDKPHEPTPRDFDELDLGLIQELTLCPRARITDLSEKLGTNRQLIGKRLRSLLADDVARVISFVQPSVIGLNVRAIVLVRVEPGKVRFVANSLVAEQSIQQIHIISGAFDLLLSAVFRDTEALFDFLRNRLSSYSGVISSETMIQIAVEKYSFAD